MFLRKTCSSQGFAQELSSAAAQLVSRLDKAAAALPARSALRGFWGSCCSSSRQETSGCLLIPSTHSSAKLFTEQFAAAKASESQRDRDRELSEKATMPMRAFLGEEVLRGLGAGRERAAFRR